MVTRKIFFLLSCFTFSLPLLACQIGNKAYGHYQKKLSKQRKYVGFDQSGRQKQGLWEQIKAKGNAQRAHLPSSANSYATFANQVPTAPTWQFPFIQHATMHRSSNGSRSAASNLSIALCIMFLLANVAHAAQPIYPEYENQILLKETAPETHQCESGLCKLWPQNSVDARAAQSKPVAQNIEEEVRDLHRTFWGDSSKAERTQAREQLFTIMSRYYQTNPAKANANLVDLFEYYLIMSQVIPDNELGDLLLRLLSCMQKLNPDLFEEYSSAIIENYLPHALSIALSHPDSMHVFDGSKFSLDRLIEKAFDKQQHVPYDSDAIGVFLLSGDSFHEQYQDRIISMLPLLLKNDQSWLLSEIIHLLKSPAPKLRIATFETITNYCASEQDS